MNDKLLIEWVNPPYPTWNDAFCPWCGNYREDGHRDDCNRQETNIAIMVAEAEVARLREALEFYADMNNWKIRLDCDWPNAIDDDLGNIARRALAGKED